MRFSNMQENRLRGLFQVSRMGRERERPLRLVAGDQSRDKKTDNTGIKKRG